MTIDEIRGLKIRQWADDEDCLIFKNICTNPRKFWKVGVLLESGKRLMGEEQEWFLWNAEFYLVGYTGRPPLLPKRKLIPLAFSAPFRKTGYFLSLLDGPRIDIFARKERAGWE